MANGPLRELPSLKDDLTPTTAVLVTICGIARHLSRNLASCPYHSFLAIVAMPGETVGIHIFEQRYQVLFNDLEAMHVDEFGIPFVHDNKIWKVGATMWLVTVQKRHSGGKRDVAVTATGLFRLQTSTRRPASCPTPWVKSNPSRVGHLAIGQSLF